MPDTTPTPRDLFLAALDLAPADRAAFLEQGCAGDAALRHRVEALLRAHDEPGAFLSEPPAGDATGTFAPGAPARTDSARLPIETEGTVIAGRYKLLQRIGEGGMGTVWMADQVEPVRRRVAVKLIRAERGQSRTILSRFEAERQAIALMDHPNIAKLLDAGTTEATEAHERPSVGLGPSLGLGIPYFVMELVKGIPLTEFCDTHRLSIPERLQLFMQVCSAVQHAHQKGVIHRDLKPSNILVESHDGRPVPKVIDFGLAKAATGLQLTEHTLFTAFGSVMGTPQYMAPEQANFNAVDVDTRADVYALGVILYELLTGTTPLTRETVRKAALDEMLKLIREQEPPTPSSRLSSPDAKPAVAANRQSEPQKLGRLVKGELDWIVLKALSKERDRRYETANGFAKDVERFLNHEAVVAGPPGAGYRVRKFVRRNRGPVGAAALVLVTLLGGLIATSYGFYRADIERQKTEGAERSAVENALKAMDAAEAEKKAREREAEQRSKAETARDRARQALDAMTSAVAGDSLSTQKEVSAEQKKFLTLVLTYYRDFAGERADDEQTRSRVAGAAGRVGIIEYRLGRKAESAAAFRLARDEYQALAAAFPATLRYRQGLVSSLGNLGIVDSDRGLLTEAESHLRAALVQIERTAAEFPDAPQAREVKARVASNLGVVLNEQRKWAEAEAAYRGAIAILNQPGIANPDPRGDRVMMAIAYYNLSGLLRDQGRRSEAEAPLREALAIQQQLVTDFPAEPDYRHDLAKTYKILGNIRSDVGRWAEAESNYRRALAIQARLVSEYPTVAEYQRSLAGGRYGLGQALQERGRQAEAEAEYRGAISILEPLVSESRAKPDHRNMLAIAYNQLGALHQALGRHGEAEAALRRGSDIWKVLLAEFPTNVDYRVGRAGANCNLGMVVRESAGAAESLEYLDVAIDTLRPIHASGHALARTFLRNALEERAISYDRLRRSADAYRDWDAAVDLSPPNEQPGYRAQRARSWVLGGRVDDGIAEIDALAAAPGATADLLYSFATVYALSSGRDTVKAKAYSDRAMELLTKAVQAGYKNIAHMKKDTDLDPLREREDFKKLLAELEAKGPPRREPPPRPE